MNALLARRATQGAILLTVLAALMLAWSFFVYVPLRVDGGWYAYPALALAEGRDPGENQMSLADLQQPPAGVKAQFEWNSRRSLYVLPAAAWFKAFGHELLSTRMFGIATLLLALALALATFLRHGGDRTIALLAWCLLAVDIKFIGSGVADMRPDLLLAAAALAAFLAIEADVRRGYGWKLAAGIVIAALLPLVHMTGPICLALLFSYGIVRWWQQRSEPDRRRSLMWGAMGVAAIVTFVGRHAILDVLVPTRLQESYEFDLGHRVLAAIADGPMAKLGIEAQRWSDYFIVSNALQLLVVLAGIAGAAWALLRHARSWLATQEAALAIGCAAGLAVVFIFDPIPRGDHVIPLVPFLMLLAARVISRLGAPQRLALAQVALAGLVLASSLVKAAHAWKIRSDYSGAGVTNGRIADVLGKTLSGRQSLTVIGPAEIWPYVDARTDIVIVDERNRPRLRTPQELATTSFVVMNDEFVHYRWREKFLAQHPGVELTRVEEIGATGGPFYLGVFKLSAGPPTAGGEPPASR